MGKNYNTMKGFRRLLTILALIVTAIMFVVISLWVGISVLEWTTELHAVARTLLTMISLSGVMAMFVWGSYKPVKRLMEEEYMKWDKNSK